MRIHSNEIDSGLALTCAGQRRGAPLAAQAVPHSEIARFGLMLAAMIGLPIVLLCTGVLPFAWRFQVLAAVLTGFALLSLLRGYRMRDLGFTTRHLADSLRANLLFCGIGSLGLLAAYQADLLMPYKQQGLACSYAFYMLFLGPVQEVIFRGILFAEMGRRGITDPRVMVAISTLSFCFLHLIYNHPPMLLITLVSGLVWSILYLRWRNIWGISLSHSVLGALAMYLGML